MTDKIIKLSNQKNKIDGFSLLSQIEDNSIKLAFFDPQYRGILDKLSYGNEGKCRGKQRCELPQMSDEVICGFIQELARVIAPQGHLFLWVNTDFNIVDLLTWDKQKMGMGYRTRRQSEYLIVLQKSPTRVKGVWTSHSIPDVWQEKVVKNHPHSKPIQLQAELIKATTNEGDYVLDCAAGGYSVLEACRLTNRNFIGGDLLYGEEVHCA